MDAQGSQVEQPVERKIPIESLSKEELIKKYRQAIVIAQKAKESKVELVKQYSEHEKVVQSLGEKLKKSEDDRNKEANSRAHLEQELKDARDIIEAMKIDRDKNGSDKEESEALKSDIQKYLLERDQYVAELELSVKKINSLESELLQFKTESLRLNELNDEMKALLDAKDNEFKSLGEALAREKELNEKNQIDFMSKIHLIQEALENEKGEKIRDKEENEEKVRSLEVLLLSKDADIKKQEECIAKMNIHVASIQNQLNDNQDILDNYNSKVVELENQVEGYKTVVGEKSIESESKEFENNKAIDHMSEEISRKDGELSKAENTIMELSTKLQDSKENLAKQEKLSSELLSKVDLLESENGSFSEKVVSLEREVASLEKDHTEQTNVELESNKQRILDLDTEVDKLKGELSEKEKLLKSELETTIQLESQIKLLTSAIEGNTQTIEEIKNENQLLQSKVDQRDGEIEKKSLELVNLSSQVSKLENELNVIGSENLDLIEKLKEQLQESEEKIKNVETQQLHGQQIEQELRQQIASLQNVVSGKDKLIQDLEQEVFKLKDLAANESTNTEVSSTFSFSRAEELSRMKDLEDSFEDKYTKLRVVAVKLKKRVTELTLTLESERNKMATEKSDLQIKLTQVASNAKTVQTLQNEVDRLQDLVEDQKKQLQQLTKDLELAVTEAATKKFELAAAQEECLRIANEKKSLEASMSSLASTVTQAGDLHIEIEKLRKDLKEKDNIIETLRGVKQSLTEQLEKVCADAKKKSVLSLEMADMEKSVSELTRQLSSERDRLKNSENEVEQGRSSCTLLQDKLNQIEASLVEKENENKKLYEKVALAKEESENLQTKLKEKEGTVVQLSNDLEKQRSLVEELNIQCSNLASKQVQAEEHARHQIDALSRQVFQFEAHSSALKASHKTVEDELAFVKTEFDNYKVRAQSVLRQSTKQEDRIISSSTFHNAEELEVEVERLRVNLSNLKENLKLTTSQLQAALQDVSVEREEKTSAMKQAQASKELYTQAIERQHAAEERLSVVLEESKQAKLHSDMLLQCYKQQLEDLKSTHQKKIASLTEQMESLQATITNPVSLPVESDQASSVQSGPSPVAEWAINLSNAAISDPDLAMRLSSLQREEGEGSESVESFPSRRISVSTQERRHELVPLDKLLSSSTYPEDDSPEIARTISSDLDVDLLQSKLGACESRAAHLTALLSEAESDAARLSQLNAVLKEEIRRQQRSEEREQHAHNLEYLKNIVVKFITLQNGDERQRLVPVLNTILKLSPEEANLVSTVAKGASQSNASGRGWGSYLPLPGWTGS